MLVLSRKPGESIVIGDGIKLTVLDVQGSKVRIGVDAPRDVPVHRQEIYDLLDSRIRKTSSSMSE